MSTFGQAVAKFVDRVERDASRRADVIGSHLDRSGDDWTLSHPHNPSSTVRCTTLSEVDYQLTVWEQRAAA